jgi:hypothetical protein
VFITKSTEKILLTLVTRKPYKFMRYQIILDEQILDSFIEFLPGLGKDEVYYLSLMARCDSSQLPSVKDGQIYGSKRLVKKGDIKRCLLEFEVPVGTYQRKGVPIPQECLSPYITINPRSLKKAAKNVAISLTEKLLNGENVDPVDFATTLVHQNIGTKHFVDFDFDLESKPKYQKDIENTFKSLFSKFITLETKGGVHMIVPCKFIKCNNYNYIVGGTTGHSAMHGLDRHGAQGMIPIPGCTQRGFMPTFTIYESNK